MKIFDLEELPAKTKPYQLLSDQATCLIIEICKELEMSLPALHASLWVFHCNSIIASYHHFDRYMFACGAVFVGSKLMECLRAPTSILKVCRRILRKKKGLEDEDSQEYLKKQVRRVFDAEVSIMINIGFDFDIKLALEEVDRLKIFHALADENLIVKFKSTLTSLYKCEVVVFFSPETIACLGLDILLKAEKRNLEVMDFSPVLMEYLTSQEVNLARREYLKRCGLM